MDEKIKLTAVIKTKNNEDRLCETLESIKDFDEIIIIDEHSSDDTIEIAKEYKAKIIYADKSNLPLAYNQALQESQNEWIFIIKENEIIPQKLVFEIGNYIQNPKKNKNCVSFSQKYFYLNQELKCARKNNILRLFKKGFAEFKNDFSLDLKLSSGKIFKLKPKKNLENAYILKFSDNDISKSISEILDKDKNVFRESNSTSPSIIIKPIFEFLHWYFVKGAIFEGVRGYIYSKKMFIKSFIYEVMLLERGKHNDL